jgi:hypothetical protein
VRAAFFGRFSAAFFGNFGSYENVVNKNLKTAAHATPDSARFPTIDLIPPYDITVHENVAINGQK